MAIQIKISHNPNTFQQLFLYLSTIMISFLIAITIFFCLIFQSIITKEAHKANQVEIVSISQQADDLLYRIEEITQQLRNNSYIFDFMSYTLSWSSFSDIQLMKNIQYLQRSILPTLSYINDIHIYSEKNDVYISTSRIQKLAKEQKEQLQNRLESLEREIWTFNEDIDGFNFANSSDNLLRIVKISDVFGNSGLIILEIDLVKFGEYISQINKNPNRIVVIYDSNDQIVYCTTEEFDFTDLNNSTAGQGEIIKIGSQKFLKNSIRSKINYWQYVIYTPITEITTSLRQLIIFVAILLFVFPFIILLVTRTAANRIYAPLSNLSKLFLEKNSPVDSPVHDAYEQIHSGIVHLLQQLSVQDKELAANRSSSERYEMEVKRYFIYRIMMGDITNNEVINDECAFLQINNNDYFDIILVDIPSLWQNKENIAEENSIAQQLIILLKNILANSVMPVSLFYSEEDEYLICVVSYSCNSLEEMEKSLKVSCEFIQNLLLSQFQLDNTIAIGLPEIGIISLSQSYIQAKKAMKYRYILDNTRILSYRDIVNSGNANKTDKYQEYTFRQQIMKAKPKELKAITSQYLQLLDENVLFETEYEFICKDILNVLCDYITEHNLPLLLYNDIFNKFVNFGSFFPSFKAFHNWILNDFLDSIVSEDYTDSVNRIVSAAIDYIHVHVQEDISLNELAQRLGITSPYLSKIFKEQTGINFKEYLTQQKMNFAQEKLKNTNLQISEIAYMIGYNTLHQFSVVFKKTFGITPNAYRKEYYLFRERTKNK